MAQNRDMWRDVVNMVMNRRILLHAENSFWLSDGIVVLNMDFIPGITIHAWCS